MKQKSGGVCALVIPVYNEAECIAKVIADWDNCFAQNFSSAYQIIVVDDGSRDATPHILNELKTQHPNLRVFTQPNQGHGAALIHGYQRAVADEPEYVFQVDSDDQLKPAEFPALWASRHQSDFVLGVRANRHDPLSRTLVSWALRMSLKFFFGVTSPDPNVPYRLMRTPRLKMFLACLPEGVFAPNVFLTLLAAHTGQLTQVLAVTYEDRKTGVSSIKSWRLFKVAVRSLLELVGFRKKLGHLQFD